MPSPMPTARMTPYCSASPLLSARLTWVADQHLVTCEPIIRRPPDVDLRVRTHSAQSVSEYTSMDDALWKVHRMRHQPSQDGRDSGPQLSLELRWFVREVPFNSLTAFSAAPLVCGS